MRWLLGVAFVAAVACKTESPTVDATPASASASATVAAPPSATESATPVASVAPTPDCTTDDDCGQTSWTPDCCRLCAPLVLPKAMAASLDRQCGRRADRAVPPRCPELHCPKTTPMSARCQAGRCVLAK